MLLDDGSEVCAPVAFDAMPGSVVTPDGERVTQVRAIIAQHEEAEDGRPATYRLYVLGQTDDMTPRPSMRYRVDVVSFRPLAPAAYACLDTEGREWGVSRMSGCGCSLRALKSLPAVIPAVWPDDLV